MSHEEQDHRLIRSIVWIVGSKGLISLIAIVGLAFILVTGYKPKGGNSEIQKDLALLVLGALLTIPTGCMNALMGLLGKGPGDRHAGEPAEVQVVNKPNEPVPTTESGTPGATEGGE